MSRTSKTARNAAVLLLRLWLGLNFALGHGLRKLLDPEAFLSAPAVQRFPLPTVSGWLAILVEFVAGLCLVVGFGTRMASGSLLAVMLGAAFVAHSGQPWVEREFALTYAVLCLFFLLHGPGSTSLDARIEYRRRQPW